MTTTPRVDPTVPQAALRHLAHLQEVGRIALRVGNSPIYEFSDQGYFTIPATASEAQRPLGKVVKSWLRARCIEIEAEICSILGDMYLDILDVAGTQAAAPTLLTTPQLDMSSERRVITARLVQLRVLLESTAPLHGAMIDVGPSTSAT